MNIDEAKDVLEMEVAVCDVFINSNSPDMKCHQKWKAAFIMAIQAVERQKPATPMKSESGMFYICPHCERLIERREKAHGNIEIPHCKWCGQKIDWRGADDKG